MKTVRRHWLAALLFLLVMGALAVPWHDVHTRAQGVPPTKVIVTEARVIDQGVQLTWLASQAGTRPVDNYAIERSSGGAFIRVARVENDTLRYLDSEGKPGDKYRIVAEDSSDPTMHSPVSEQATAAPAKPGSVVVVAPAAQRVLGAATILDQAKTAEAKAAAFQQLATQAIEELDGALNRHDSTAARKLLVSIQDYQRQLLALLPLLATSQKAALAQTCTEQMKLFTPNVYVLSERDRMDGLLVLAGCQAVQESI